ncbi:MAG: TlpA disulfide reductase family protein [Verrucomicrobiota bacterium]
MKHCIASLFIFCASLAAVPAAEPTVGSIVPALSGLLPGASLPKITGKVVLVDFWASWCAPCKASFATLSRLQQKYGPKGLVVIGIGVDDEMKDYQTFVQKNQPSFTLAHDSEHKAAAFFNPATMPTSYLVDRNGTIRHIHKGFKGGKTEAEYAAEIQALLGE